MAEQNIDPVLSTNAATNGYMAMLNVLPAPVYYANRALEYCFANDAYCKWLGLPSEAVTGHKIVDILGQNTLEQLQPYMNAALSGKKTSFDIYDLPYFKKEISIECCYIPDIAADGNVTGFLAFITDVTGKHQVAQQLQQRSDVLSDTLDSERTKNTRVLSDRDERYNLMISEVEDYAILSLDPNGIIQNWNKGAQKIKGYTEAEIVGKSFKLFYQPEDQQSGLPDALLATARREGRATHEGWRVRKDGSKFWGSVLITAVHDNNGTVVGYTKVTRDLTERKNAEDQLRQNARELQQQNKELEQFAYIASHDLKEPLRKILVYCRRILEPGDTPLSGKQRDFLAKVIRSGERMEGLIEDILAYSRTTMAHEFFEAVDLSLLIPEIAASFQHDGELYAVQISSDGLPVVKGIPYQLSQLFENLFSNAVKYRHPDRPLEIRITCKKTSDGHPGTTEKDKFYNITFADNGLGFDNQFSEQIFELFQRLVTKDEYEGTGLGLAICRKIMQAHRGYITASGEPGRGATFELFFPLSSV